MKRISNFLQIVMIAIRGCSYITLSTEGREGVSQNITNDDHGVRGVSQNITDNENERG